VFYFKAFGCLLTGPFELKNRFIDARFCAVTLLTLFAAAQVSAQPANRNDKIMTIAELRACFKLKQANQIAFAEIAQEQQDFKRDDAAVKAEQAEVLKAGDELRARSATITAERDTLSAAVSELSAKAPTLKTDAEKAEYEVARAQLTERSNEHQKRVESLIAAQKAQRDRIDAVNERISAINLRAKTVNDRVEPQQKQAAAWREQCGSRRYREEDEIVVNKELAAGK
jgi:chromosome segregation ATPase